VGRFVFHKAKFCISSVHNNRTNAEPMSSHVLCSMMPHCTGKGPHLRNWATQREQRSPGPLRRKGLAGARCALTFEQPAQSKPAPMHCNAIKPWCACRRRGPRGSTRGCGGRGQRRCRAGSRVTQHPLKGIADGAAPGRHAPRRSREVQAVPPLAARLPRLVRGRLIAWRHGGLWHSKRPPSRPIIHASPAP
jgi:hypothetical protein